jgi:phytoene dehydrogenase-like protein
MGGCSGIIDALHTVIKKKKNRILHKKITAIMGEERVIGVIDADGNHYRDSVVVSDIGAKATSRLITFPSSYQKKIDSLNPSRGMKYTISCKKPVINHGGVMFTPGLKHVGGINQVTNVDPSLAPRGYHMLMAHQRILSQNFAKEREKGLVELDLLLEGIPYEILGVQFYRGSNPVNHAATGYDMHPVTPIEGLYLVGDAAKGRGGIEVEGIAMGIETLMSVLKEPPVHPTSR